MLFQYRENEPMRSALNHTLFGLGLLLAGCIGNLGDPDENSPSGGNPDPEAEAELVPAPAALPRLTEAQYRNVLADLFGPSLPALLVEPDTNPYLFESIGAASTTLSELGTQHYEENADAITHAIFNDPSRRAVVVGCSVGAPGDACTRAFITRVGRTLFRRPLSTIEVDRWVAKTVELAQPDAWEGLRLALAGMLQAPSFLYRVELGEPDPERPDELRLTGFEMASRMSFLLWNTGPDAALLDAAEAGELDTEEGLEAQAERLLSSPRAKAAMQGFFAQYLDLGKLGSTQRNPANYPLFSESTSAAMRLEVEKIVDDLVFGQRGDMRALFSTQRTFVNPEIAAIYGISPDFSQADADGFVAVQLDPNGPRAGILTFSAFLTMNAHETQTSPTTRGKYIRERVLCQEVTPPPADVDTEITPPDNGELQTLRESLEEHRENPQCAGCHAFIDPPGFLFEHFDSIGAYRTEQPALGQYAADGGQLFPIDSSGDLDGEPLADADDLARVLADDERVGKCMVKQLFRHSLGRIDEDGEAPALDELDGHFAASGYDFQQMLVTLITHESFRRVALPDTEGPDTEGPDAEGPDPEAGEGN